mgnify:CR=1 FL=1
MIDATATTCGACSHIEIATEVSLSLISLLVLGLLLQSVLALLETLRSGGQTLGNAELGLVVLGGLG